MWKGDHFEPYNLSSKSGQSDNVNNNPEAQMQGILSGPEILDDILYEGCQATSEWAAWYSAFRQIIKHHKLYSLRYNVCDTPPVFVPFDEHTKRILWNQQQVKQFGYSYVNGLSFERVAFCEELYRPAAEHAAHPDKAYDENNDEMHALLQRPHGFASAPKSKQTEAFMDATKEAAASIAATMFRADNIYELIPLSDDGTHPPQLVSDSPLIEFFAPGDNVLNGWSMGSTPMALVDALELGVAYLDRL